MLDGFSEYSSKPHASPSSGRCWKVGPKGHFPPDSNHSKTWTHSVLKDRGPLKTGVSSVSTPAATSPVSPFPLRSREGGSLTPPPRRRGLQAGDDLGQPPLERLQVCAVQKEKVRTRSAQARTRGRSIPRRRLGSSVVSSG